MLAAPPRTSSSPHLLSSYPLILLVLVCAPMLHVACSRDGAVAVTRKLLMLLSRARPLDPQDLLTRKTSHPLPLEVFLEPELL